jgi:hypothetical protein
MWVAPIQRMGALDPGSVSPQTTTGQSQKTEEKGLGRPATGVGVTRHKW